MPNQYAKETLNKLSTSIDLTNPNGLEMSAAFDKYVERVIKPIYPKGTKIRQTSTVDDKAGLRTVDWSFRDTSNKIQQAVQAAVDNFVRSWGEQRGLIDAKGNPVPDAGAMPMQVGGITPQVFNVTRTRILNPRTAASIARKAVMSGGDFITDKNTGMSTWSVADTALTLDRKNLSRSLRAEVREGDKRWLEGRVALSSLAEGASPANAEERALAINNRNFRTLLAKHKAMTPEQEKQELMLSFARSGRRAAYMLEYEKKNPLDPRVFAKWQSKQKTARGRVTGSVKFGVIRALSMARAIVQMSLGIIIVAVGTAISLLRKINASVIDIGSNIRRQATEDMRYNFDEGLTRQWARFAEKRGFDKEVLSQAAGGIAAAWSSPLSYSSSNFDTLAPYLRESTKILVRQATADGDQSVLHIMGSVIDDLVGKSLQGMAGSKPYTGQSRMTAAFTENMTALQNHNGAWAQLMQYYWRDLTSSEGKFKAAARAVGKEATFENWLTQSDWNPDGIETGNGVTNSNVKTAAEKTYETVLSLGTALNALKTDVLERIAGSLAQVAEDVRSKISNLLVRYFPAFAMKEKERAVYLNTQALAAAENNLPGYRATAEAGLRATGFDGTLEDFKPIWKGIMKRDSAAIAKLPATVNLDALDAFIRYQAPAYYETIQAIANINTEDTKIAEDSYIPRAIVYDPASNATRFSSLGMAAGFGLQHIKVNIARTIPHINSGSTGFFARVWGGGPLVNDPYQETPVFQALNWLGLQMVSDVLTGNTAGAYQSRLTEEERKKLSLANRIQGSYNLYKGYEKQIKGYENVADNDVFLLSPTGQMMSEVQAAVLTDKFHAAEKELYNYLAAMYDTENPQYVLNAYDTLAAFYHDYGHLARVTDPNKASQLRAQIKQDTNGVLFGDWVNDISTVYTPDEVLEILREKRSEYIRLNKLESVLTDYQISQTLPIRALKQSLTNDGTIPISLIEMTNQKLMSIPSLPSNLFEVLNAPNTQGVTFDVDENAVANRTQAVTNVYVQLKNGRTVPILNNLLNTGLTHDVTVVPGQDVMQALFEAFSATQ